MKMFIGIATLLAVAYATPIELYTGPTNAPPPALSGECPSCAGREDGDYQISAGNPYFLKCSNGIATCQICDPDGALRFNPNCGKCMEDESTTVCPTNPPTKKPVNVCTGEDNAYAVTFCQNLASYPGLGAFGGKSGDFRFEIFVQNPDGSYSKNSEKSEYYISCVEGMYGWCRPCPDGLVWYNLKDDAGNDKKDCGICDYPPSP